jgi:small subunit ribosomal protein S2
MKTKTSTIRAWHPFVTKYLVGARKDFSILGIGYTLKQMMLALWFLVHILRLGGNILVVNTSNSWSPILQNFKKKRFSISTEKWVGGTLTNYDQVSKTVETVSFYSRRFQDFLQRNKIFFSHYEKRKKWFIGFREQKPDLVIIMNPDQNKTILQEAFRLNIPTIAFVNSSTNFEYIYYPIVVNSESHNVVSMFCYLVLKLTTKARTRKKKA